MSNPFANGVQPSDDFVKAKATIMAMPEQDLRQLAIAQFIQLQFHEKYGNTMQNMNAAFRAEQIAIDGVNHRLSDERIMEIARSLSGPIQTFYAIDRSAAIKFARAIEREVTDGVSTCDDQPKQRNPQEGNSQ